MAIQNLNQGTPTGSSLVPFFDQSSGRDASCSVTQLAAVILATLATTGGFASQYAAPNVSGFAITVNPPESGVPVWLLITPVADYADLTINLPVGVDQQEVLVCSTHAVTGALTVTGALVGAANQPVNGAPATLTAGGFFRLKFDGVNTSWYRVG